MFEKKSASSEIAPPVPGTLPPSPVTPEMVEQIHVMPSRFQLHPRTRSNRLFVVVGLVVIVLGAVAAAALVVLRANPSAPSLTSTSTPTGIPSEPQPTPTEPVSPTPEPIPQPTPVEPAPPTATPDPQTQDADGDALTTEEELLYSTLPTSADSDSDGYPDGSEVVRGYSPRVRGVTLLADGLVSLYTHSAKIAVWYPTTWEINDVSAYTGLVIFDSRSGEQIAMTIRPNDGSRTAQQWMSEDGLTGLQLLEVVPEGFSGARTATGREAYLVTPDRAWVVALRYTPDWVTTPKFPQTLLMMAASVRQTQ